MDQEEIDKLLEEFKEEGPSEEGPKGAPAEGPKVKGAELLSQEEIDALLQGLEEGAIGVEEEKEAAAAPEVEVYEPFDFRKWELLELEKIESLKLVFDRFAKDAASALSDFLHRPAVVDFTGSRAAYFEDFVKKVPLPTGLIILKVLPVKTYALLVLDARTVFYAIDALFGGGRRGRVKVEGREFTPIETRIIRHLSGILLESLRRAWEPIYRLEFAVEKVELSPELAAVSFQREAIVVGAFEVDFGGSVGAFSLCLPSELVKAFRDRMATRPQAEVVPEDPQWREAFLKALEEVPLRVEVEFAKKELALEEFLGLKVGDVILFSSRPDDEILVRVEGIPLFKGKAGVSKGRRAVKITDFVD